MPDAPSSSPPSSANPAPLGLAGFGLTTVVLSAVNNGLLPHEAYTAGVPRAFGYGEVAQIIAGILGFPHRQHLSAWWPSPPTASSWWWRYALLQLVSLAPSLAQDPSRIGPCYGAADVGRLHAVAVDRQLPAEQGGVEHLPTADDYVLSARCCGLPGHPDEQAGRLAGPGDGRRCAAGGVPGDSECDSRGARVVSLGKPIIH